MLMHPCSTFPGKYSFLSKSGWITESVCMVTQSPPKLNIPQLSTKRSPSSAIRPRFIQPLVSSVKPQISTCIQPWNLHKNHLSAKLITTRKIIIQAQILAMERIALSISLTAPSLSEEEPIRKLPPPPGRRVPVITAPKIQTSQIFHPIPESAKLGPNSPKIKAGPQLLQITSILRAASEERCPFSWAKLTHWAPDGYPPRNPSINSSPEPGGILHSLATGSNIRSRKKFRPVLMTKDRYKKGNRAGTTVRRHSCTPSVAPAQAAELSRIRATAAPAGINIFNRAFIVDHLGRTYAPVVKFIPLPS